MVTTMLRAGIRDGHDDPSIPATNQYGHAYQVAVAVARALTLATSRGRAPAPDTHRKVIR